MARCKDCIHYTVCSIWSTTDLDEDEAHRFCFGNFKSTEDVVPRSEVEKAKQEAYKKVFEEIKKKLKLVKAKWIDDNFYKLDGYELDCIEAMFDKDLDLAELENNYIGEKK